MITDPRAVLKAQTPSQAQVQDQRRRANQQPAIDEALETAELARTAEPVGSSKSWWGLTDPAGGFYLIMDGRELDPLAYPDLYAVLGVRFNTGGETPGFFRLPNTAGRVISGAGTPSDPAITTRAVGDKFGEQNHLLASTEMPAHDHGGTSNSGQHDHSGNTTSNGLHNHKVEFTGASNTNNNGSSDRLANVDNQSNPFAGGFSLNAGAHTHNLQIDNGGAHSHNLASAGGGLSHNNLQPSIAAYDIMRVLP